MTLWFIKRRHNPEASNGSIATVWAATEREALLKVKCTLPHLIGIRLTIERAWSPEPNDPVTTAYRV